MAALGFRILGLVLMTSTMPVNQTQQNANTAAGIIQAGNAPTQALSNISVEQLLGALGLTVPTVQEQAAESTLQTEFGLAGAGIGQEQNALQQQGLAAQLGLAVGQQGLEQQQFANTMTQFPEQLAQAAQAYGTNQQNLQGSLAASGTLNTQGSKLQQGNLAEQYGWQQQDIARNAANAALGQQSEVAGYGFGLGDIARQQQNLQLAAQQNGLSVQQMLSQWQQGLQQAGINANPEQAYGQYLQAQGQGIAGLGGTAAQSGLLLGPGQLAAGGLQGGVNVSSLFAGQP